MKNVMDINTSSVSTIMKRLLRKWWERITGEENHHCNVLKHDKNSYTSYANCETKGGIIKSFDIAKKISLVNVMVS